MKSRRGARQHRTPEFRAEALKLLESSPERTVAEVAKELGIPKGTLADWSIRAHRRKQAAEVDGRGDAPLGEVERAELVRLRAENVRLHLEREILKKATAFFVKESE